MPTVLDQLVVELILNIDKFVAGVQGAGAAQQTLNTTVNQTTGQAQQLNQAVHGVGTAFGGLGTAGQTAGTVISRVMQGAAATVGGAGGIGAGVTGAGGVGGAAAGTINILNVMAAAGQRAGTAVARSGQTGASGVQQIALAGLAAYESLRGIRDLFHDLIGMTEETAQLGRVAGMAGVNPQWLSTFQMWMQTFGAAPEQVGRAVLGIQQSIQKLWTTGDMDEKLKSLWSLPARAHGLFGNISGEMATQLTQQMGEEIRSGNIPQIIQTIMESISGLKPETATSLLQAIGIDPSMIPGLLAGLNAMASGMEHLSQYAPTQDQIMRYQALWGQVRITEDAFSALARALLGAPVTNMFDGALKGLEHWAATAKDQPEELKLLRDGFLLLASAVGIEVVSAFMKLTAVILRNPLIAFLTTAAALLGAIEGGIQIFGNPSGFLNWLTFGAVGTPAKPGEPGGSPGSLSDIPGIYKTIKDYLDRLVSGGGGGGANPNAPGVWPRSYVPGPEAPGAAEATARAEGTFIHGKIDYDVPLGYGRWGVPSKPISQMTLAEAYGFGMQMRAAQAAAGVPWDKTSSAVGAFQITGSNIRQLATDWNLDWNTTVFSPELQNNMRAAIRQKYGFGAWEGFRSHPELLPRAGNYVTAAPQLAAGGAINNAYPATTNHNYGDASTSIGQVVVNAPTGNSLDITRTLGSAIKNNSLINQANQGME